MMRIYIHPFNYVPLDFAEGKAGDWRTTTALKIKLGTSKFDGMKSGKCYVKRGYLYVDEGFQWNGSNLVKDTDSCLLASLVHDCLCLLLRKHDLTGWNRFWLRRRADRIYKQICSAQNMWGVRAGIRFLGLRIAAPFQAVKYQLTGT